MNSAIKYGAIMGLVGVGYSTVLYMLGPEVMMGSMSYVGLVITIGLFVYFGFQLRKDNGGFITFGEAFKGAFVMILVSGAINIMFSALLFNVIDPELADVVKQLTIERMESMFESFNMDQEAIDQAMIGLEEQDFGMGLKNAAIGFFVNYGAFGAIGALILAAIVKKQDPQNMNF